MWRMFGFIVKEAATGYSTLFCLGQTEDGGHL